MEHDDRRSFFARALASVVGLVVAIVPLVSGLVVFFDPLGRKTQGGQMVRITTLSALPPDGQPRRFPVIAQHRDAWSQHPGEPIGSVYLHRNSETETPEAFTSVCPHLGCAVSFQPAEGQYLCPCHNSAFTVDGSRVDPARSPSPRDLDSLAVEIRNGQEVWVDYRRFVGGIHEKVEE
jgi:Rieske Fe-S protein